MPLKQDSREIDSSIKSYIQGNLIAYWKTGYHIKWRKCIKGEPCIHAT